MRFQWLMMMTFLSAYAAAADGPLPRPQLATELAACQKSIGVETPVPAARDYPGGLSKSADGLTPASAPGVTTVSPKVAACLVNVMGSELHAIQVVQDETGIRDALYQPLGGTAELTAHQAGLFQTTFAQLTAGKLDRTLLVYCHHVKCFLSYNAALRLRDFGYKNVLWMREGIEGWKAAGLPIGLRRAIDGAYRLSPFTLKPGPSTQTYDYPVPPNAFAAERFEPLKRIGFPLEQLCADAQRPGDGSATSPPPAYFKILYNAAGIDVRTDHEGVIRRKMQAFWTRHGDLIECGGGASFGGRSLLKTAVDARNAALIFDIAESWKLPLNKVDLSDGWTALDYVQDQFNQSPSNQLIKTTYSTLRDLGALHRSELEEKGLIKSRTQLQAQYLPLYKAKAEAGDLDAMDYLFVAHLRGKHMPVNQAEGMRWFERMNKIYVEKRDYAAMAHLAFLYAPGYSPGRLLPVDERLAYEWARRSADGGNADGMRWAGVFLLAGRGVTADIPAGVAMLQKSYSAKKDAYVALELGRAYDKQGDTKTAATWLRLADAYQTVTPGVPIKEWFKQKGLTL